MAKGHSQKAKQNKTKQNKKPASEWEKRFANHRSDKDLVSKIYKLNNKRQFNRKMSKT